MLGNLTGAKPGESGFVSAWLFGVLCMQLGGETQSQVGRGGWKG